MPGNDTPQAHEDLYMELMRDANETGTFVLETEEGHPNIDLEVEPADKPVRNKLQRLMPDGLFDSVELPDDVDDLEEISVEDIDTSEISFSDMMFSEEATEVWLDEIAEHYSHDYYSNSEVREIFNTLEDDFYISAGSYLIELGSSAGPVTGFRREDQRVSR